MLVKFITNMHLNLVTSFFSSAHATVPSPLLFHLLPHFSLLAMPKGHPLDIAPLRPMNRTWVAAAGSSMRQSEVPSVLHGEALKRSKSSTKEFVKVDVEVCLRAKELSAKRPLW